MKGHWIVPILVSILILGSLGLTQQALAELIYESATLGPTGKTGGGSLNLGQFLGSRFSITETVEVTSIGGHIGGIGVSPELFGVIVELPGPSVLPAGSPFTGSEVLASTVFTPPGPSSDVSVPLSVILTPGDYAIIFGSGLFGATSSTGFTPQNDVVTPAGSGSFILWSDFGSIWIDGSSFRNERYTINGNVLEQTPVGGTILPIDTTALLVAGAYTTASWMIPILVSAVGIGLAVFTLKRSR